MCLLETPMRLKNMAKSETCGFCRSGMVLNSDY